MFGNDESDKSGDYSQTLVALFTAMTIGGSMLWCYRNRKKSSNPSEPLFVTADSKPEPQTSTDSSSTSGQTSSTQSQQTPSLNELTLALKISISKTEHQNFSFFFSTLRSAILFFKANFNQFKEEGIYRKAGDLKKRAPLYEVMKALMLENNVRSSFTGYDVHDVIGVIKQAWTDWSTPAFSAASKLADLSLEHNDFDGTLKTLFQTMIDQGDFRQAFILHNMFYILHQIDAHSESNKMPYDNLKLLFMPTFRKILGKSDWQDIQNIQLWITEDSARLEKLVKSNLFEKDFSQTVLDGGIYEWPSPQNSKKAKPT